MKKKTYAKPTLKSQVIELGVFGDYTDEENGRSGRGSIAGPVEVIQKLDLHMD
ncbi:MAG: hypothetical protein ACI9UQ_001530 [Candidatus Krumholzibacteriia bacterium]|jgi:hypothetical protein